MTAISSPVKINNKSFNYLVINGVITAVPTEELDRDLLDELSGD